jgi:hypothetical protein
MMGRMEENSHVFGRQIQQNRRQMEVRCARCYFLGELDAAEFDMNSPDRWQNAADRFAALGWTCKDGRTICPECSAQSDGPPF